MRHLSLVFFLFFFGPLMLAACDGSLTREMDPDGGGDLGGDGVHDLAQIDGASLHDTLHDTLQDAEAGADSPITPDSDTTPDTTPGADVLVPDGNGGVEPFCSTFGVDRTYCNDLSNASLPAGDASLLFYDPFSGGLQTTSWLPQGYGNSRLLADGALRFTMHDGAQNDTGVQFPMSSANLPTQINIGFVMRIGANFLQAHTGGSKFVLIEGTTRGTGWRPTLFLNSVTDTQGRFGAAGSRYWVFIAGDDAAGLMSDEFGWMYPQEAYAAGNYHTFRLNNYVDQWIYVEYEAVLSGTHKVYVATADGAFDGATPLAEVQSRTTSASLPWRTGRVNAYPHDLQGTNGMSTVDVDLLQVHSSHMGPPPAFFY